MRHEMPIAERRGPKRLIETDVPRSREELEAIARRALSFATADETRINIGSGWEGNTRFAVSEITTSGGVTDLTVTVTSTVGRRQASATTNLTDDAGLRRTVELSERLARLSPEDPELVAELGPQQYPDVDAFARATADLSPEARATAAQRVIEAAHAQGGAGLEISGFLSANAGASAVATSKGLFAYHPQTSTGLSATARTDDGTGSGWAATGSRDWSDVDAAALGRRAAEKAVASRNPQAIEPGRYTVILEPNAVASLVPLLMGSFNARSADEGRSAFAKPGGGNRIGEKIADERVTLYSDPVELRAQPFANDGAPTGRVVWIGNGVLRSLNYDRYWAERQGVPRTPAGGGLKMNGGTSSLDEIIAGTQRAILVTRLWYIRSLDQRTVLVTGLTRDGTFLVENGRITRSLKNFRWNDSPLFLLNKIEELGWPQPTGASQVMPAIKARDFEFASISDAV
ncbi:MAG TPA: TldD/PmbA family protein [Gemmatimonadaceae bacterium]|nr:TldD/PmbA family protein [Gemmatimonadaceae bacterium]